jgi:hypothetical protein
MGVECRALHFRGPNMHRYRSWRKDGVGNGVVFIVDAVLGGHSDGQQMQPADRWVPPDPFILCKRASRNAVKLMLRKRDRIILWVEGKHD